MTAEQAVNRARGHGAMAPPLPRLPLRRPLRRSGAEACWLGRSEHSVPACLLRTWTTAPPCSAWISAPTVLTWTSPGACRPTAGASLAGVPVCLHWLEQPRERPTWKRWCQSFGRQLAGPGGPRRSFANGARRPGGCPAPAALALPWPAPVELASRLPAESNGGTTTCASAARARAPTFCAQMPKPWGRRSLGPDFASPGIGAGSRPLAVASRLQRVAASA